MLISREYLRDRVSVWEEDVSRIQKYLEESAQYLEALPESDFVDIDTYFITQAQRSIFSTLSTIDRIAEVLETAAKATEDPPN